MKKITIYFLLFFVSVLSFAQNNHSHISIKDETKGKIVTLFAVNSSNTDYEVFLKVNATGFRNANMKPITKVVPANSKVEMFKLIKIKDAKTNYTFGMIVNEINNGVEKNTNAIDFTFNESKKNKPVIIFVKDYCDLCENTVKLFRENNLVYTIYNIDEDYDFYANIKQELLNRKNDKTSLVPIIKIEDSIYNRLESRDKLIQALKNHF